MDACVNLARADKWFRVLASTPCWDIKTSDPSSKLSPYTTAPLRDVTAPGFSPQSRLLAPIHVASVRKAKDGSFHVTTEWKKAEESVDAPLREPNKVVLNRELGEEYTTLVLHTPNPSVLATCFKGSTATAAGHPFAFAEDNDPKKGCLGDAPLLTKDDESTKIPGIFLVVQHESLSFCFVYKFR